MPPQIGERHFHHAVSLHALFWPGHYWCRESVRLHGPVQHGRVHEQSYNERACEFASPRCRAYQAAESEVEIVNCIREPIELLSEMRGRLLLVTICIRVRLLYRLLIISRR